METEWDVLKDRGVFELVDAPPDAHIIDSMWVFVNKYDADSNIIRCKAHLVAKGYTQIVFSSPVKSSFFTSKRGNWQPQPV